MAGTVYSTQFIMANGTGPFAYVVPAGKLAIVKCLTAANNTATSLTAAIYLTGLNIWVGSVPAHGSLVESGLHIVLNAGQVLNMSALSPGMGLQCSGYLLDKLPTSP